MPCIYISLLLCLHGGESWRIQGALSTIHPFYKNGGGPLKIINWDHVIIADLSYACSFHLWWTVYPYLLGCVWWTVNPYLLVWMVDICMCVGTSQTMVVVWTHGVPLINAFRFKPYGSVDEDFFFFSCFLKT